MNKTQSILTTALALCLSMYAAYAQDQSIHDLDFLIGVWDADELVYEGRPSEYHEIGVRTCTYYMDSTYIRCHAFSSRHGKDREYEYLFNYDQSAGLFIVSGIYSDYDMRGRFVGSLNREKSELNLVPVQKDSDKSYFRSKIVFRDNDKMLWYGWTADYSNPDKWNQIFVETALRRTQ